MLNRTMPWKSLLLCILLIPLSALAEPESELERFEQDATSPSNDENTDHPPQRRSEHHPTRTNDSSDDNDDDDEDFGDALAKEIAWGVVKLAYYAVTLPGEYSLERVRQSTYPQEEQTVTPRETGDREIPFVRADVSYNYVNSDIYAFIEHGEIGYGPFGFQARAAQYKEHDPEASLDIKQYHWLYRMSLGDNIELDLGLGRYELSGVSNHSGESSTLHLLIYPTEQLGIELRPSWANVNGNSISDHELAITYGERYWSALAGYHWLESPESSLNGPFIGFSLRL